ncbi:hypothetical protein QYF61_007819 [Mycteria americana]|uniref:Uncharacterized protein n=1 Tax=Mycteria americana TaxID=33587 RepID=A0AAN7NUF7_MYCAM|nr:hypothetical protein QYF61_007819 [Mycteria americana]
MVQLLKSLKRLRESKIHFTMHYGNPEVADKEPKCYNAVLNRVRFLLSRIDVQRRKILIYDSRCSMEQGWRLNHFPGQPVPRLDNPFSEVKFPNIQSKPPLAQLEAISSRPITCYLGEETDPHLSTTSFQAVVESDKVSPQPPFLQAKQPQVPQLLLIRLLLQTLHQLCCPSLDTLQHLNVSLVVGGPKLNTVFEVRPHQCRVQGHDHCPSPAGHTVSDTSQDAIGFLGPLGTLLAHIQAAVNKHPQVLLCWAAFQPLFPKPVALHGVAVAQVQDLALGLVEPHTIGLSPSIQPVQVPLQSLPTLSQINTPAQLGVVCKLTESTLDPFVQIIDKDVDICSTINLHELQVDICSIINLHELQVDICSTINLHGLQVDICSTINLHGLQVDICSTINLHGLQGDICSTINLHGLRGTACLTMVFTRGCRGISAPAPGAPPPPPSSLALLLEHRYFET